LGTREPTADEIIAYLQGADLDHGHDFMGHKWSVPSVAVWRECYRVLKPGGHLVSFGGTRTWDLISLGLRAAGFENRDTIASNYGPSAVQWVQGQGFPKSANILKNMAKDGVAPDIAAEYSGLGTALKPSWEPALIFRKPIAEKTVAKQVLKTGTGAINIDGCRVGLQGIEDHSTAGPSRIRSGCTVYGTGEVRPNHLKLNSVQEERAAQGLNPRYSPEGRWPSNLVFVHSEGCRRVGSKKVDARVINRFVDGAKPFGNGAGHAYESEQQGDAEGKEEIAVYKCVEPHTIEMASIEGWCVDITHAGFDEVLSGLDHLRSVLADTHTWDTGNTQLNAPECALPVSSLQGSKGGCPACSRFYGEQVLLLQETARASLQQLGGARELSLGRVRLLRHNQRHRHGDLRTNDGVSLESSKCENIASSKSLDSFFSVGEIPSHTQDSEVGGCLNERLNEGLPNNTLQSSIFGGVRQVSSFVHCNACNDTELRLFFRESLLLASRFLPGCVSIRTFMVSGCPVKALDDQSGVLKTSGGVLNRAGIGFHNKAKGNQDYVPPSEGGASRFFPQFEFECVGGCPVKELGEQSGVTQPDRRGAKRTQSAQPHQQTYEGGPWQGGQTGSDFVDESPGTAARFFPQFEQLEAPFMYATKVSKSERDAGLPKGTNNHPTVKNLSLMRWLVRLVTPKGGTVLDPYAGSGSTLIAAMKEGFNFIGIERDPEFHRIAEMRVEANKPKPSIFDDMEDL
jgi:hypothetical protein